MTPAGGADANVEVLLARAAAPDESLAAELGEPRLAALRSLMERRARAWADAVVPDAPLRAVGGGVEEAVTALLSRGGAGGGGGSNGGGAAGVTIVIAPELARWRAEAGAAALEDLAAGCALSFGPVFDGGLYLLALSTAALAPLGAAFGEGRGRPVTMSGLVELAAEAGLELGMVRSERSLRHAEDARALLADPLTDEELRVALG